jgi:diguanylate cyclase (GGDEF)-like protein/PAS domain S-box-containing protein
VEEGVQQAAIIIGAAGMAVFTWCLGVKGNLRNLEAWTYIFSGILLIFFGCVMGAISRLSDVSYLAIRTSSLGDVVPGNVFGFLYGSFMLSSGFFKMWVDVQKPGRTQHGGGVIATAPFDVKERKCMEEELLKQLAAIEASMDGIAILDKDAKYVYLNHAHAEIYGYDDHKDLIGKTWRIFYGTEEITRFEECIFPELGCKGQWRGRAVGRRRDGSPFHQDVSLTLVQGEWIVCIVRDITEQKNKEALLARIAYYDTLTGLPNRLLFNESVGRAMSEAQDRQRFLAIMFIDLDRFKTINDTLGHNTGDILIHSVAQRLKSCVLKGDVVTRFGGDEFIILFPNLVRVQDAAALAQKIIRALSRSFVLEDRELFITASIGISIYPVDGADIETLVKNADCAMYVAKEQGRNNYQFYTSSMNAKGLEMLALENSLRKALERQEFLLYYQPQIDLNTGKISGVEALLRWHHPEWGILPPKEFIALAEETGIIVPLGKWMMYAACGQIKKWQTAGFSCGRLAVNLSMRQFRDKALIETINGMLQKTGLDPALLELELTESIIMQNPAATIATLRELSSTGIHLAIDDFGTGYSSLNYLKYLPLSRLKIAQAFVSGIVMDPNDKAIAKAIIALAHNLNMKVIAEGVETVEQLEFFRMHKCDEVQGYLFSEPLPAEDFERMLRKQSTERAFHCSGEGGAQESHTLQLTKNSQHI